MDPLRMIIAMVPLAAYLLLLGLINLRRRPVMMNGACDNLLLGLGLAGLAMVGPLELLLPESTAFRFGGYAWVMLIIFYLLLVLLLVMLGRPRLVVYNVAFEQLRPALADVVGRLDDQARWTGDSVFLPNRGVQFYLDRHPQLHNVQITALGNHQNFESWHLLEKELRVALRDTAEAPRSFGIVFIFLALAMLAVVLVKFFHDRGEIAQSFHEMLRR